MRETTKEAIATFNAIENAIKEKGVEVEEGTKVRFLADKVCEVYDAGKQAEYDAFWDIYQNNGNRTNYGYAFANVGWNDATFKPKYNIILNGVYAGTMTFNTTKITDLAAILNNQGVYIDTSGSKMFMEFLHYASITKFPVLDLSNATSVSSLSYAISSANLKSIEKLIVSENTIFHTTTFDGSTALENVVFEGVIAQNGLDLHWSTKLSKASITSIINALSTTTSGLTVTLSQTAVNNAFTTEEWNTLVATKTNWTISLV